MRSFHLLMLFVLGMATGIQAQTRGVHQTHLVTYSPDTDSAVPATSDFRFTFDLEIEPQSVKEHTVMLKQGTPKRKKIKGDIYVKEGKTIVFSPSEPLQKGNYTFHLKPVKLLKEGTTAFDPQTWQQKTAAWLCSPLYDDVTECSLCSYLCNIGNTVKTKPIRFDFEVKEDVPKVISLETNTTFIELSEHNQTAIKVMATYDNNITEDVTDKAAYSSSDSSVDVDKGILSTHAEGSATVTVSYGGKSTALQVEVYKMIDGHLLPHAPQNPDATLLGVDANNNDVRDDVERWIFKEMPTYHHPEIERVIAMQKAKAYQMTLKDPINQGDRVLKAEDRASDCWSYYADSRSLPFDGAIAKFGNRLRDKQFNTPERLRTYLEYDQLLGGRVFTATPLRLLNTNYCDQNIDILP
ncbi:MAG: hypothetical protein B5M46_01100 [Epsilonproteobacteria bacterium 4484_20]|nr:MAG: hypothetical protein B5M46_01100 [Epsilonproteobacteria bacterium 4484_20]